MLVREVPCEPYLGLSALVLLEAQRAAQRTPTQLALEVQQGGHVVLILQVTPKTLLRGRARVNFGAENATPRLRGLCPPTAPAPAPAGGRSRGSPRRVAHRTGGGGREIYKSARGAPPSLGRWRGRGWGGWGGRGHRGPPCLAHFTGRELCGIQKGAGGARPAKAWGGGDSPTFPAAATAAAAAAAAAATPGPLPPPAPGAAS